jgi:uncharacterized protein (TIGR02466 family)
MYDTKDLIIDEWFPTTIGVCEYKNFNQKFYTSLLKNDIRDLHLNPDFENLNIWVTNAVNQYAKEHKFVYTYEIKESFSVNYYKGQYQSVHGHNGYHISAVFYVNCESADAPIVFRSPYFIDSANPYGNKIHDGSANGTLNERNSERYNKYTYPSCYYVPKTGRLLIFRSYVQHEVLQKQNDCQRIVISYNFNPKKEI